MANLGGLPADLPVPEDDGAADHLTGMIVSDVELPSTDGDSVSLARCSGLGVLYVYPMTGRPDAHLPDGWDTIPGARGCTPQSCAFRDHFSELQETGVNWIYGISTQTTDWQAEAVERLHLPFALLSDSRLRLANTMRLPTFTAQVEGQCDRLLKRLTLIVRDIKIVKVFYPVFPPDRNAEDVLVWLRTNSHSSGD